MSAPVTSWRWTVLLAAIYLAGFSAQLAMTQPLWFQYVQLHPPSRFARLYDDAFIIQGLASAAFLLWRPGLPALWRGAMALGPIRVIAFLAASLLLTVAVMSYVPRHQYTVYAIQLVEAGAFLAVNLANALALACACPVEGLERLSAWARRLISLPGNESEPAALDRWLPGAAAVWVLLVTAVFSILAFQRMPRIPDEVAYLFQARYLAHGVIAAAAPPADAVKALQYDFMTVLGGRWFSIFPPGWPAVLALGVKAGVPWLVNPLLGAAAVLLAHRFMVRATSRGMANLVILLLAASPWFLAMSASLMSHTLTLVLVLGAWLLILRSKAGAPISYLAAGALMGLLFLTRPLEGVSVGVLTGLWTLKVAGLRTPKGWASVFAYGLACAAIGGLIFPYNAALVGNPLQTPVDQYFNALWGPGSNRMGFGPDIGSPDSWGGLDIWRGHSPLEALIQGHYNLVSANFELFGWGVGSLALVLAHKLWGRWKAMDLGMAAIVVATVGLYGLYWFNGGFYIGPRYWFMILFPLVVLSARGAVTLTERLSRIEGLGQAGARLGVVLAVLMLAGAGPFMAWRGAAKYFEFRGFHADYRQLAISPGLGGAAVFIKGNASDYASAFMLNDPALPSAQPVFLRDLGPEADARAAAALGGRPSRFVIGRQTGVAHAHFAPVQSSPR